MEREAGMLQWLLAESLRVGHDLVIEQQQGEWKNIQKTKIMASGPITSWQIEGGKVEVVADFTFLHSKIPADGDGIHKIKDSRSLQEKLWQT